MTLWTFNRKECKKKKWPIQSQNCLLVNRRICSEHFLKLLRNLQLMFSMSRKLYLHEVDFNLFLSVLIKMMSNTFPINKHSEKLWKWEAHTELLHRAGHLLPINQKSDASRDLIGYQLSTHFWVTITNKDVFQ